MSYENLEVPQIQLIVEVVDIPVVSQRQVPTVLSFVLQVLFLEVVDMPIVVQRQVHAAAVCRQGLIPVVAQRQIPMVPSVRRPSRFRSCSPLTRWSSSGRGEDRRLPQLQLVEKIIAIRQFMDKVVACPLVCNKRCLSWQCRKLRFSAFAVHRQGRRYPYCDVEANPHGSVCSENRTDSPVAH